MLSVREVTTAYQGLVAISAVSIDVAKGEIVCVAGANGAGKSTLLKTIAGAERPRSGAVTEARLTTVNPVDPLPAEYALLKDEISLGRGEDNDVVIPHASISRAHARLMRRNGTYELMDLNSTNGSYVNEQPVHGSTIVASGSEVRLGDIKFILRF